MLNFYTIIQTKNISIKYLLQSGPETGWRVVQGRAKSWGLRPPGGQLSFKKKIL